ncbi:MAG TPA: prephenate dehydrogenase/arogenate dehydrogenase family protein [Burkholderiales bacterium]|nr:prephenate dehydrogenase/arogenate dehydrogenase family protein [Burkholderiales bacterium]
MSNFHSDRLVVIGVGLIGGSVAAALKRAGKVRRVIGVGRGRANIARALELGVIDDAVEDIAVAVKGADAVLIAVPVQQNQRVLGALAGDLAPGTLVTDAGSTKQDFVAAVRRIVPRHLASVVPGHPIAGAELTGVDAASAILFDDRNVVLTPLQENEVAAVDRAEAMWKACGARVSRMTPERHDRVFSAVSHLPHMLAYTLVHMIATRPDAEALFGFAAGGFRDFTRIAGSSAEMWRDIALANREALLADIEVYQQQLAELARRLRQDDGAEIERIFEAARSARNAWMRNGS